MLHQTHGLLKNVTQVFVMTATKDLFRKQTMRANNETASTLAFPNKNKSLLAEFV